MQPGERWNEAKYHEMNVRYQEQTLEHLRELAGKDEPFFLQYWPLYPLTGPRTTTDPYTTPNGGNYVEKMKLLDTWIGDILAEMEKLGVADNTLVIIMGDNGHFTKYSPGSGFHADDLPRRQGRHNGRRGSGRRLRSLAGHDRGGLDRR